MSSTTAKIGNNLRQLKLLLWKNYLIQKRSKIGTIAEIIVPTIFVLILLPIRTIVKSEYYPDDTVYQEFSFDKLPRTLIPIPTTSLHRGGFLRDNTLNNNDNSSMFLKWKFAYQPNSSDIAARIMDKVGTNLGMDIVGKSRFTPEF